MMSLDNKTWIVRQIRCIANKKAAIWKKLCSFFLTINIEKKEREPRDSDARPTAATHENLKKNIRYFTMKQQQQQHESDIKTNQVWNDACYFVKRMNRKQEYSKQLSSLNRLVFFPFVQELERAHLSLSGSSTCFIFKKKKKQFEFILIALRAPDVRPLTSNKAEVSISWTISRLSLHTIPSVEHPLTTIS